MIQRRRIHRRRRQRSRRRTQFQVTRLRPRQLGVLLGVRDERDEVQHQVPVPRRHAAARQDQAFLLRVHAREIHLLAGPLHSLTRAYSTVSECVAVFWYKVTTRKHLGNAGPGRGGGCGECVPERWHTNGASNRSGESRLHLHSRALAVIRHLLLLRRIPTLHRPLVLIRRLRRRFRRRPGPGAL
jgi:hypothetical protein